MTSTEALRDIRGYAAADRVVLSNHAWHRMAERGARRVDVVHSLSNATSCQAGEVKHGQQRWRATGPDVDGDEMRCVVVIEDGVLVVTMF